MAREKPYKKEKIFKKQYEIKIMTIHQVKWTAVAMCGSFAFLSILQTLNSRYLFKDLHFDYYTFVLLVQKISNIIVFRLLNLHKPITVATFGNVLPYSGFSSLAIVISSYCLTVMPLAAYMALKKLIVLFVLLVGVVFKLPNHLSSIQYYCIVGIVVGGIMVGEKDILSGHSAGYLACLCFNLFEALSVQYSAYLYHAKKYEPQQLLLYNSMISLPYYFFVLAYEAELPDIYEFLSERSSLMFFCSFLFSIVLACTSELTGSYIAMKISPFSKAIISNIKDMILVLISVLWLYDFSVNFISGSGIVLCLTGSTIFAIPYLEKEVPEEKLPGSNQHTMIPEKQIQQSQYLKEDDKLEDSTPEDIEDDIS